MTRYYYDDPLAAAWMLSIFGMQFETKDGNRLDYCHGQLQSIHHLQWENEYKAQIDADGVVWDWEFYKDAKYYIHPESLHLLEPKDGDEGVDETGNQLFFKFGKWVVVEGGEVIGNTMTDKRDGKPFHWPKQEHCLPTGRGWKSQYRRTHDR